MVEYANTLPTPCQEYAKAYPLLSLLPNKRDKTAAIDAYWHSAYNLSAGFDPSMVPHPPLK
jgi:hypothetical protein